MLSALFCKVFIHVLDQRFWVLPLASMPLCRDTSLLLHGDSVPMSSLSLRVGTHLVKPTSSLRTIFRYAKPLSFRPCTERRWQSSAKQILSVSKAGTGPHTRISRPEMTLNSERSVQRGSPDKYFVNLGVCAGKVLAPGHGELVDVTKGWKVRKQRRSCFFCAPHGWHAYDESIQPYVKSG